MYVPIFSPLRSTSQAVFELFLSAFLWGFGFIATVWALRGMGPYWATALRFLLAVGVMLPFFFISRRLQGPFFMRDFWFSIFPGIAIGSTLCLQSIGLKQTSVTNSSFITSLYVVFVPILEPLFLRSRPPLVHVAWVSIGLIGTGLITRFEATTFNQGDLFTLGCALMASLHIVLLGKLGRKMIYPFRFNIFQSFWAGLVAMAPAMAYEHLDMSNIPMIAMAGLSFLVIGSTLLAFTAQVRAQTRLSPSTVSMLFLLEAPLATLMASFLLHESLVPTQFIGACLIFIAGLGVVWTTGRQLDHFPRAKGA